MTNHDDDRVPCSEGCDNYRGEDGERCGDCQREHDYWAAQWEAYGRHEVANRYTEGDVTDCYSEPCESAKRAGMMREVSE